MQHSIKEIGKNREELSALRKEKVLFDANDFFNFALNNMDKYHIVKNGDDLLVSTWYSDSLLNDYKKSKSSPTGILYINYSKDAEPIADEKILDALRKEYNYVKNPEQNKQFNVSNALVFTGVHILCMRGEMIAEKIVFMNEGEEVEMVYDKFGSSKVNIPNCKERDLPNIQTEWLQEYLGF